MFFKCDKLEKIECSDGMDWSKITNVNGEKMFYGCPKLPNYDATKVGLEMAKAGAYFTPDTPSVDYFAVTIDDETASGNATLSVKHRAGLQLLYKLNDGDWTTAIAPEEAAGTWTLGNLNNGDKVLLKGENPDGFSTNYSDTSTIELDKKYKISGQLTSLVYGDETSSEITSNIPSTFCFCNLFGGTNVVSISSNLLPFTKLKDNCYYNMFSNCSNLTNIADGFTLPAETLAVGSYYNMFYGCSGLTELPDGFTLPAEGLKSSCYKGMFKDCCNLVINKNSGKHLIVTIPSTDYYNTCVEDMFNGTKVVQELKNILQ